MLTLNPGKEPFNQPASRGTSQLAGILCLLLYAVPVMWGDHLITLLAQFLFQFVTVIRTIINQVTGFCLDHVAVKTQLYQVAR